MKRVTGLAVFVCTLVVGCGVDDTRLDENSEAREEALTAGLSASATTNQNYGITSWELRQDAKNGKRIVRGFGKKNEVKFHGITTLDRKRETLTVQFKTPKAPTRTIVKGRLQGTPSSSVAVEMLSAYSADSQTVPEGHSALLIDWLDCIGSAVGCISPLSGCRFLAALEGKDGFECCTGAFVDCSKASW